MSCLTLLMNTDLAWARCNFLCSTRKKKAQKAQKKLKSASDSINFTLCDVKFPALQDCVHKTPFVAPILP